uniref:Uncharacterized protein n=1 Tax=Odontella aurita TaxID=265563 RepID=A0A6U6CWX1_9STRA
MLSKLRASLSGKRLIKRAAAVIEESAKTVAASGKGVMGNAASLGRDASDTATKKVTKAAMDVGKRAENASKIAARKASDVASEYVNAYGDAASKAAVDAAKAAGTKIRATENAASEYASLKGDVVRHVAKDSARMTMDFATGAAARTKESTVKSLRSASQSVTVAATSAKDATASAAGALGRETFQAVRGAAGEKKKKALRWVWWWSLSAVGVYGLATSIPREMRLAIERNYDENDDHEK